MRMSQDIAYQPLEYTEYSGFKVGPAYFIEKVCNIRSSSILEAGHIHSLSKE